MWKFKKEKLKRKCKEQYKIFEDCIANCPIRKTEKTRFLVWPIISKNKNGDDELTSSINNTISNQLLVTNASNNDGYQDALFWELLINHFTIITFQEWIFCQILFYKMIINISYTYISDINIAILNKWYNCITKYEEGITYRFFDVISNQW